MLLFSRLLLCNVIFYFVKKTLKSYKYSVDSSGNTGTTQVDTETENTNQVDTTNGGTDESCVDHGWEDWSCKEVSDFFLAEYYLQPSQWCTDPDWSYNCCLFCSGMNLYLIQNISNFFIYHTYPKR